MRSSLFPLMVTAMSASLIGALPEWSELVSRRPTVFLQKRQTGSGSIPDVPAGCQSTCDPVNSALSAGCSPATCCEASFEMGYFNCFECAANALNVTDFSDPQSDLDELIDTCAALGLSLPKLTFPGQNPNRTISTVASSAAKPTSSSGSSGPPISSQITISNPSETSLLQTTSTTQLVQSTVTSIPSPSTSASSSASIVQITSFKVVAVVAAASFYFSI